MTKTVSTDLKWELYDGAHSAEVEGGYYCIDRLYDGDFWCGYEVSFTTDGGSTMKCDHLRRDCGATLKDAKSLAQKWECERHS